jgi:ubiquinone/menaquinone biosynthesis C-methylase UbiE
VVLSEEGNPRLPSAAVDAVLIANTFHQLRDPKVILDHVSRSLRPDGRLVIVDRGRRKNVFHVHEVDRVLVDAQLQQAGFEIVNSQDRYIDRAGDDLWFTVPR